MSTWDTEIAQPLTAPDEVRLATVRRDGSPQGSSGTTRRRCRRGVRCGRDDGAAGSDARRTLAQGTYGLPK